MARPKKVAESLGDEPTKQAETTKLVTVKVEPAKEQELKVGDTFLVYVNGAAKYWTRTVLNVAIRRKVGDIQIPKGSPYQAPLDTNCVDCG